MSSLWAKQDLSIFNQYRKWKLGEPERIDYDTLYSHVLRKIRECARAALMDGKAVADRLTNTCEAEQREQREAMERSLTRDEERIEVLDKMVMRLYEDHASPTIANPSLL